jgi:hypothetical protein
MNWSSRKFIKKNNCETAYYYRLSSAVDCYSTKVRTYVLFINVFSKL